MASWPPAALPIAYGLPGSFGPATRLLFGPLRLVVPIGWIGGMYSVSKPIAAIAGRRRSLSERRAAGRIGALRTRKDLVPGRKARRRTVDNQVERAPVARGIAAIWPPIQDL